MEYIINNIRDIFQFFLNSNYLILIIIGAIFIFLMARNRTYRLHSFRIRSSLNSIMGFSNLLSKPEMGDLSKEQLAYINEIKSASALIKNVIDEIEKKRMRSADKSTSYQLRAALMSIDGYCFLLSHSKPDLTPLQLDYLKDIKMASLDIMREIGA